MEKDQVNTATHEDIGMEVFESAQKPLSTIALFWREIKADKKAVVGLIIVAAIILFSIVASAVITTEAAIEINLANRREAPSWTADGRSGSGLLLGADDGGRNMFHLLVVSTRNSLLLGFTVSIIGIFIGVVVGIIAGFYGGHVDNVIMRIVDTWTMLPGMMFIIALIQLFANFTMGRFIFLLVLFSWMARTRLIRSMALQQRNLDYVHASKTLGTPNIIIIFREVLPNMVSIISANIVLTLSASIGMETGLSLLGYGLPIETPSLGTIIFNATNLTNLQQRWWMWLPAIVLMFVMMLCINFVGQAVSRAADPRQRSI